MLRELYRSLALCSVLCPVTYAPTFKVREFETDVGYELTLEYHLEKIFLRNDNGMFEEREGDNTVVVRSPGDPIDVNGRSVFFYEGAPDFKYFSCKNYTAMNSGGSVEVCETLLSLRCIKAIKGMKGFSKNVMFPDGKMSQYLDVMCGLGNSCCDSGCCTNDLLDWMNFAYKIFLILAPFFGVILLYMLYSGAKQPPKSRPLAPQEERLRRYRDDLEEMLRCIYEGRR